MLITYTGAGVLSGQPKGTFQKRFSGFFPLRGTPPTPLTENQCEKKGFFSLAELGGTPFTQISHSLIATIAAQCIGTNWVAGHLPRNIRLVNPPASSIHDAGKMNEKDLIQISGSTRTLKFQF